MKITIYFNRTYYHTKTLNQFFPSEEFISTLNYYVYIFYNNFKYSKVFPFFRPLIQ